MGPLDLEMTAEEYKEDLANVIAQMMFVSGETAEPSSETTTIIEEIVHTQVVEMVRMSISHRESVCAKPSVLS